MNSDEVNQVNPEIDRNTWLLRGDENDMLKAILSVEDLSGFSPGLGRARGLKKLIQPDSSNYRRICSLANPIFLSSHLPKNLNLKSLPKTTFPKSCKQGSLGLSKSWTSWTRWPLDLSLKKILPKISGQPLQK